MLMFRLLRTSTRTPAQRTGYLDAMSAMFVGCPEPECLAPAEVMDRIVLASTGGPVEHARIYCVQRHFFVMPLVAVPGATAGPDHWDADRRAAAPPRRTV